MSDHPVRAVLRAVLVIAVCALVGAGCGWLWYQLWAPPATGVVAVVGDEKLWLPQPYVEGYAAEFSGTGWYVVVAALAGLAVGFVAGALTQRRELLLLAAALVGSAAAAWVMYVVGVSLGPPDPHVLASDRPEGATLEAALVVEGRSPFLAFPIGTCLGLTAGLLGFSRREPSSPIPRSGDPSAG